MPDNASVIDAYLTRRHQLEHERRDLTRRMVAAIDEARAAGITWDEIAVRAGWTSRRECQKWHDRNKAHR